MKSFDERTEEIMRRADSAVKVRGRLRVVRLSAIYALCAALVLAIGLTLFLPFDTTSHFTIKASSNYYEVAKVIDGLTYTPPKYKNNFQKLSASLSNTFSGCGSAVGDDKNASSGMMGADSPDASAPSSAEGYVETTDNQVAGVIEGDLLKRTTTHAFYYEPQARKITAYSFAAGKTTKVGTIVIGEEEGCYFTGKGDEMYLSADGKTITVFAKCYDKNKGVQYACAIDIDVKTPANMREMTRFYASGDYVSSRMVNGEFLLVSNYKLRRNLNFNNEYEFLPHSYTDGELTCVPAENIVFSSDAESANYTVVYKLGGDLSLKSSYAFLSYSEETYASRDNIYLTNSASYQANEQENEFYTVETTITCLDYSGEGLTLKGSGKVYGTILNQYSMDEYDGNLRVVTDVVRRTVDLGTTYRGANLYSVSLTDFTTTTLLSEFCPNGESVQSARFDKATVYVCTAMTFVELTDPVYAIDVSDYNNVTFSDTGTIPGYSMSLRTFKDGTLLGIGYGEWRNDLKISVYEEMNGELKPTDLILEATRFSAEYKSYFIDAERGLVGLSVNRYNNKTYRYEYKFILVQYTGYGLEVCEEVIFQGGDGLLDYNRAFYDDGYLYIFTQVETASIKYL